MSLFQRLLGRTSGVPDTPHWISFPLLSIAVFGSPEKTADLQNINSAFLDVVRRSFPASDEERAENSEAIESYYQGLVGEKLQVVPVPDASELGNTDKVSRLWSVAHSLRGMIWLLVNEEAKISPDDANRIPAVMTEFLQDPKCMVVQGKGYHAFVRAGRPTGSGRLSEAIIRSGFVAKRVKYLTIDPRNNRDFEL